MNKHYIRLMPDFTTSHVRETIRDCALQASYDAYQTIISEPHVYFTIANEPITKIEITEDMLDGGFFGQAGRWMYSFEGIYVYLAEQVNSVMFAEDHLAMDSVGITPVYPCLENARQDPKTLLLQLTEGPHPINILEIPNDILLVGWFLGVLCTCDPRPKTEEIVRCTYADVLARRPVFEGLVISSFDGEGFIFLMKKECYDKLFAGKEYIGHGLDWYSL